MGYERYPRNSNPQGDYYDRDRSPQDYGRDYGSGADNSYSSARDYAAADQDRDYGRGRGGNRGSGRESYGREEYGRGSYGRDAGPRMSAGYGREDDYGRESRGGGRDYYGGQRGSAPYRGSYASDGHRFAETEDRDRSYGEAGGERYRSYGYGSDRGRNVDRGRPQGYDQDDRGFLARAGDEVRSWFGDEDAERRREMDQRYDERMARHESDQHYNSWRNQRLSEFDRDYDEYRRENATKFSNEFTSWRTERQGQRDSLSRVKEHMEVVGSDGEHVGTVDKVRGDRILLTKNDKDAGGRHHSIPSRWIESIDDKVTIRKTSDEAQREWRDEENNQAMFGDRSTGRSSTDGFTGASGQANRTAGANTTGSATDDDMSTGGNLNRSFSGTY